MDFDELFIAKKDLISNTQTKCGIKKEKLNVKDAERK